MIKKPVSGYMHKRDETEIPKDYLTALPFTKAKVRTSLCTQQRRDDKNIMGSTCNEMLSSIERGGLHHCDKISWTWRILCEITHRKASILHFYSQVACSLGFCQVDTTIVVLEEGSSIEKIPLLDWPAVHFLDWWLIWEVHLCVCAWWSWVLRDSRLRKPWGMSQ